MEPCSHDAAAAVTRDRIVRDEWTEHEDHAAWLVVMKVGLPLESVAVWAGARRRLC
jgi:hypothetical protein